MQTATTLRTRIKLRLSSHRNSKVEPRFDVELLNDEEIRKTGAQARRDRERGRRFTE